MGPPQLNCEVRGCLFIMLEFGLALGNHFVNISGPGFQYRLVGCGFTDLIATFTLWVMGCTGGNIYHHAVILACLNIS